MSDRPMSHYKFLDTHFDTILTRMGKEAMIGRRGNFSASGDKYYSYRERWEHEGIPWYHGAVMYHLLELLYSNEARQTSTGWVHPYQWVIDNYKTGHNLSQYMKNLTEGKSPVELIWAGEFTEIREGLLFAIDRICLLDVRRMKRILIDRGYTAKYRDIHEAWEEYSNEEWSASWLGLPENNEVIANVMLRYLAKKEQP